MNTLMLYGDSVLKGVFWDGNALRYSLAGRRIDISGWEIRNHAHFGATADKVYDELVRKLRIKEINTVVLFGFGGNDCDYDWDMISADPDAVCSCSIEDTEFISLYLKSIAYARSMGCGAVVMTLPPIDASRYLDWISKGRSRDNILQWLGGESMIYRWHEYYNDCVCSVARSANTPVIDIRTPFLVSRSYGELMGIDGIHPSLKGHGIINKKISEYLENI